MDLIVLYTVQHRILVLKDIFNVIQMERRLAYLVGRRPIVVLLKTFHRIWIPNVLFQQVASMVVHVSMVHVVVHLLTLVRHTTILFLFFLQKEILLN